MQGERDKDTEALMAVYGIGRRLATRVVALRTKGVDVSGTVLAEAARKEPVEGLLLLPDLLRDAEALGEARLKDLASQCGVEGWDSLRLVCDAEDGWRTIALEDDVLAQEALKQQRGGAGGLSLVRAGPSQISVRETEGLFTPEEVARLKLSALTSQNAEQRIESLRKLVFAPMDGAQKAGIFLNVLVDREAEPKVRREAVRSLEQIGLRSDVAEALRGILQEQRQEAIYAIQRLAALLRDAEPGEEALALSVILEVFDQGKDAEILRELLRLIGKCASILVGNYPKTEQFFQSALRHLVQDFGELRWDVEGAVRACIEQAPELAGDLIRQELRRSTSAPVRGLLINLSQLLPRDEGRVTELAQLAVEEILNPQLPESERGRLRYGLVRLGEPVVLVALGRMAQATGIERLELIRLVDVLCTESDVSHATLQKAVSALLDMLKLADAVTRRSILEAGLLVDNRVDRSTRQEVASELLALMAELNLPSSLDMAQYALERIGAPAARPACAFVRRAYPSEAAQRAALALAHIVQEEPDQVPEEVAREVLKLCMGLLEDEGTEHGAFTIALAAVCGYTRPGAERFEQALRRLKDNLWKLPYSMDALDALGVMAGSDNAQPAHQQELFQLFDGIVRFQARTGLGVRRETGEGTVYEFGREIEFDVRAVPAAVRGLERICVSPQASEQMRADVVKRLLVLWEGVSKVRIIWGPAAIEALIGAMCRAANAPMATADMKVRLGASLLRFLNKLSVIRSVGEICSQPDRSAETQRMALQAGTALLNEWAAAEPQDVERRLALLKSAARVAANTALSPRNEAVRMLRERALQALYAALREGMNEARESLLLMRDCPDLSAAQRREIDERLSKAFGLVRAGPRR